MPFRILSLDGGGAWSLIQARALAQLYGAATTGHRVLGNFDLVAANSGGSLVLAGLVENLPIAEIVQYFLDEQKRRSLFPPTRKIGDALLQRTLGIGPKYSAVEKLPAIERLQLPAAADRFWDGGITGCNNPVVAAAVEALVLGQTPQDLRILSLGTATVALPLAPPGAADSPLQAPRSHASLRIDLQKLAGAILDDPPDAASFIAHAMTGANAGLQPPVVSRIVRMSPLISPLIGDGGGLRPPDGWSLAQFQYLCNIHLDAVAQIKITYIDDYCACWLADKAPNQPIRSNGTLFDPWRPEIGYARFSEAKAAWQALFPPAAAAPEV